MKTYLNCTQTIFFELEKIIFEFEQKCLSPHNGPMISVKMAKNMTKFARKKNIFFLQFFDPILWNSHLAIYKCTFYVQIPSTAQSTAILPKFVGSYATKLKGVCRWSIWTPRFIFLTKPSAQSFLDAFLTHENIFELCANIIFGLQKIIFFIWKNGPNIPL